VPGGSAGATSLYRLLRALAAVGVFHETENKEFSLDADASDVVGAYPFRKVVIYGSVSEHRCLEAPMTAANTAIEVMRLINGYQRRRSTKGWTEVL
jgi:hypothetical protein